MTLTPEEKNHKLKIYYFINQHYQLNCQKTQLVHSPTKSWLMSEILAANTFVRLVYTSAHTLARSLHDVSCANNNRFAVVVCFRLAFHASGIRFFLEILEFKIF